MTTLGQLCLLVAMVGSGYAALAAFAARVGRPFQAVWLRRTGLWAAIAAVSALTTATAVLAWALLTKDFRFAYVVQYSNRQLPWHYSLSAAWVGQAGSLLVWAWLLGVLALVFRLRGARFQRAGHVDNLLHNIAFGVIAAYLCFLITVIVFGADPMEPSIGNPQDGAGLGPLLQHPIMLVHPPVVFLGYACSAFPFALAIAALFTNQLDAAWPRQIRSWALATWAVLGAGILLGADWAYEELGWGGYWGWDPVENGSLIPWLTGTALLHTSMAWQRRGVLKKATLLLAIATMGLCNFAAFVTRSGIFSSVHERIAGRPVCRSPRALGGDYALRHSDGRAHGRYVRPQDRPRTRVLQHGSHPDRTGVADSHGLGPAFAMGSASVAAAAGDAGAVGRRGAHCSSYRFHVRRPSSDCVGGQRSDRAGRRRPLDAVRSATFRRSSSRITG
jgi:cytochrome c biogenesis factor